MIPDNVEKIIMTKEDYDRNVEQLLLEKINAEQEIERLNKERNKLYENGLNYFLELKEKSQEIERLNNIINDIDTYIHLWKLDDIGEKTMLILNDILLIKNGMSDEVIRLKGSSNNE